MQYIGFVGTDCNEKSANKESENPNIMRNLRVIIPLCLILQLLSSMSVLGQEESKNPVFVQARSAMQNADAESLLNHFGESVSLNFNGVDKIFRKVQSKYALEDFFTNHSLIQFEYSHFGKTSEGTAYAIGKYTYKEGSFLVYIMVKEGSEGETYINSIAFHED